MAATTTQASIPAFLGIDVEPEGFQVDRDPLHAWAGFASALDMTATLRDRLAARRGEIPQFGWYFRTDPQIRETLGRSDAAMASFGDQIRRLRAHGDYFGVHMHPVRWSATRNQWVHDFGDRRWLRDCTHASLDAFEAWNGSPARHFRSGAGFLNDDILDVLEARGVAIEMSLEPVTSWGCDASVVPNGIDDSPIVGEFIDCARAPAVPYYPSRGDFRRRGGADARQLLLVPLSSGQHSILRSDWWSKAKRAVRRLRQPLKRHMYYPSSTWPSPRYFWDLVESSLGAMRHPYLSLAIRTDRPGSRPDARVRALLEDLVSHPLAQRLRFVDPLAAMETWSAHAPVPSVTASRVHDALAASPRVASARAAQHG